MLLITSEHYDIMVRFEREFRGEGRLDREPKERWAQECVYQDAAINGLFLAYRKGYAFGKAVYFRE